MTSRPPGTVEFPTALAMADAAFARSADRPLVHYFETALTGAELDRAANSLAAALGDHGVEAGDRVVVQLQNMPQFVIAAVAIWKVGAIVVPTNPMYRARELTSLFDDARPKVLITLDELYGEVRPAIDAAGGLVVLTTSGLDYLDGPRPAVLASTERVATPGALDMSTLLERYAGRRPRPVEEPADIALLVYTSGTTGPPKGAMISHDNLVFSSTVWRDWCSIGPDDVNLGIAPLFHITGLVACLGLSLLTAAPVVLAYRFDPVTALELIERFGATFTVAAITAFTAMMNADAFDRTDLSSLRVVQSGGAPIAPAIVEQWEARTGLYIHPSYGMTETTAPTHFTPIGTRAPVDPSSGALAVGIPVYRTNSEIHDDDGRALPPGEIGQIVSGGPQVVRGYWEKPDDTAATFPDGRVRTGDVGFQDEDGWFYIVDRSKDLIVASGYKVWPREVEDVLVTHPAVREAAVVGVPDAYRGEDVRAFVSLRAGRHADDAELIEYCRERMAAYKRPRAVVVLDDLPKTASGKILRRELRARAIDTA